MSEQTEGGVPARRALGVTPTPGAKLQPAIITIGRGSEKRGAGRGRRRGRDFK